MNAKFKLKFVVLLLGFTGSFSLLISCNSANEKSKTETAGEAQMDVSDMMSYDVKPLGPINPDTAERRVDRYRNGIGAYGKTNLIWHEPSDLKFYIDSIFIKYTSMIKAPNGYHWKLAISPMIYNEKEKPRLTFCFLPCLVDDTNSKKGYDFFVEKKSNSQIYTQYFLKLYNATKYTKYSGKDSTGTGFIFDEGQLWP